MATVKWVHASAAGAMDQLSLVLTGCRLLGNHAVPRDGVDGVAAVVNGVAMEDSADGAPQVMIANVGTDQTMISAEDLCTLEHRAPAVPEHCRT